MAQGTPPAAAAQSVDVAEPIRAAVRWLRSKQDPLTGAYDGSVQATALALRAFATCPDRYRAVDGPFVRRGLEYLLSKQTEDGLIGDDPAADANVRKAQTRMAVEALVALGDADSKVALGRALAALGSAETSGRDPRLPENVTPKDLQRIAQQILAEQTAPGRWEKDAKLGVVLTAANVITLSEIERLTKKSAPASNAPAVATLPKFGDADRAAAIAAIERGVQFLVQTGHGGKWGAPGKPDAGLTAMVLGALQAQPVPRPEALQRTIDEGLQWLVSLQKPDGSIHDGKLANYITSAAVMAFAKARDARYEPVISRAREFLIALQADEGEGFSEGDLYYGGIGYGSTERPDLSNLQMALEALASSGLEPNAPTYRKALKFLERCQNRSESNDVRIQDGDVIIQPGNDGGASYLPGDSKAGFHQAANGVKVPRSYGSMTYALLKCMVFAGLERDDPRLAAAFDWVRANYTLDINPGFETGKDPSAPYQGLYYYFHTMAQALHLLGVDQLTDAAGRTHVWRRELCGRMVSMQSKLDGSWTNANSPRWMEGNPLLGTSYALLTLETAMPR